VVGGTAAGVLRLGRRGDGRQYDTPMKVLHIRKEMTGIECLDLLVASKKSWSPEERKAYAKIRRLMRHQRKP
jgi:hypothetical protein